MKLKMEASINQNYFYKGRPSDTAATLYLCSSQPGLDKHNAANKFSFLYLLIRRRNVYLSQIEKSTDLAWLSYSGATFTKDRIQK